MESNFSRLNFDKVSTHSIAERRNKIDISMLCKPVNESSTLAELLRSLPNILAGKDFINFVAQTKKAIKENNSIIWMMGAHPIKCGLSPLIIELINKRFISHLAMNGACAIHDTELALFGKTSEYVEEGLVEGTFGMAKESANFINDTISENEKNEIGYGEALSLNLKKCNAPYKDFSILYNCIESGIPISVHSALGTEIIHQHPSFNAIAYGRKAYLDFQLFAKSLTNVKKNSIIINLGSCVILPEVFLKALTIVRNLNYEANGFHTAVFDMIKHYRPSVNVERRPVLGGGKGYYFICQFELLIPLFIGLLLQD